MYRRINYGVSSGRTWSRLLSFLCVGMMATFVVAKVPCTDTEECVTKLRDGSTCDSNGYCTNPFWKEGCLSHMKPGWKNMGKRRVCNSDDPPEANLMGYCDKPDERFDYLEIRISPQNWVSVFVETWLIQILLSEVLGVPTSVETGKEDTKVGFYDVENSIEHGISNDWAALEQSLSMDGGRCENVEQVPGEAYKSCSHFIPEVWLGLNVQEGLDVFGYNTSSNAIDPPIQLGVIAQEGWLVPKFTAERDPSLLSFLGLMGEENRKKLADRFLRPTTWVDYCTQVSSNNCTSDDGVAKGAPRNEAENSRYFVEGIYTGHFRKTEKNDCENNPTNCTGHIADYPCGWSSNVQAVARWNGIAVESDGTEVGSKGYTYSQMIDILKASNATKSDLLILWWSPDLDYNRYLGTESELIKVSL